MNSESANRPRLGSWRLVGKLFLPSWNFFNDFAEVTRLEFCWSRAGGLDSVWQPLHPLNSTQSWWRVFFNPAGNLDLLEKSLIDRIAAGLRELEAGTLPNFETAEEFEILARLTRARLHQSGAQSAEKHFRFRLVLLEPGGRSETLFESTPQTITESAQ